ncbi:MAG: 3-oxoadipate enol-lactonase [Pseudomonadota bacterium]
MGTTSVNGINLHHQIDGPDSGIPVLLSNSLASNLSMWDAQTHALVDAGYRVVRYDSRGHGRSDAPEGPYSVELLADDAAALIDALDIGPVHFCGLSKGGMVGQMLGSRHPSKIRSLAICASAAYMGPADIWDGRIAAVRDGGMEAVADATLERWFTPGGHQRLPGEIARVREMIVTTPPIGFIACCEAIRDMDQRESNAAIQTPCAVLVGADDPSTTPDHAQIIADSISGATMTVIPDSAHFFNCEQPDAFNAALLAHLTVLG